MGNLCMYGQSFSLKTSLELSLQIYLHKNVFSINFSMNRKSMKKTDKIESPTSAKKNLYQENSI